jgi:hypothetical protein
MKHNSAIDIHDCLDVQIASNIRPKITQNDVDIIVEELTRAGMRAHYLKPRFVEDTLFVGVDYKKPTVFIDDDGKKFCVGYYTRTTDPAKVSERIMQIIVSKSWQRMKSVAEKDPNADWNINYCIQFNCNGHTWVLGRKKSICGYTPKGLKMIYKMVPTIEPLRQEIASNIALIKRYIDGGQPVIK